MHLVYILNNNRQHNLGKLLKSVKSYSHEFITIFPQDTQEEKRLFELLKAAYVDARYNPDFEITKEDLDTLFTKVERLMKLVKRLSEERIQVYEQRIEEEEEKEKIKRKIK